MIIPQNTQILSEENKLAIATKEQEGDIVASGGHYILPHGIKSSAARGAYPALREKGYNPEAASKIAWYIEKKNK